MIDGLLQGFLAFFDRPILELAVDVVDILVVAFIIYRVLLALKGTRAAQMGIGLGLIFLAYHLASRVGLVTLYTFLDRLVEYIVLLVVVIFQDDIRRVLMRAGQRPFFRHSGQRDIEVIAEVVEGARALAQKRIGALIVFERDAALDDFVEDGTKLEAAVSKELLYSIFVPSYQNPMHDGAVILRDGRIWQAGVFLPLTRSTNVSSAFGTRHRAAIGITEETDAVVVIVSEERGAISLCFNGNIAQDLDPEHLRDALHGLLEQRPADRPAAVRVSLPASEEASRSSRPDSSRPDSLRPDSSRPDSFRSEVDEGEEEGEEESAEALSSAEPVRSFESLDPLDDLDGLDARDSLEPAPEPNLEPADPPAEGGSR